MPGQHAHSDGVIRASLLVLLLLALVARPVLIMVGEVQLLQHALQEASAGPDACSPGDHDHRAFQYEGDRRHGHVKGSHSLMHQSGPVASIDGVFTSTLPVSSAPSTLIQAPDAAAPPRRNLTAPFRPPIA